MRVLCVLVLAHLQGRGSRYNLLKNTLIAHKALKSQLHIIKVIYR
jgi:hypothetical protein